MLEQFNLFLREGDFIGFSVLMTLTGLFSTIMLYLLYRFMSRLRIVQDTPTSKIRSAAQGYVEIQGVASMLPGEPVLTGLTSRECIWHRYEVLEKSTSTDSRGRKNNSWKVIRKGTSEALFSIKDNTGQCIVDPDGAEVTSSEKLVWYGDTPMPQYGPEAGTSGFLNNGRYRYIEERIKNHQFCYIIGLFRTHGSAQEIPVTDEMRVLLAQWKKDPSKMQQFDANNDGNIDQLEWEQVRQAARAIIVKERAERASSSGTPVISKPLDKRRPYLISVDSVEDIVSGYRWRVTAVLIAFVISSTLLAWGLSARF